MRITEFILSIAVVILLVLLTVSQVKPPEFRTVVQHDTILVRDTIVITQKAKVQYKIKEIRDTVIVYDSTNFVACIDTSIKKSQIMVCYSYPESIFSINLKFQPDTIQKTTVIEKPILKYEQKKDPWYYDALKIGGGVVVGFMLGRVK